MKRVHPNLKDMRRELDRLEAPHVKIELDH